MSVKGCCTAENEHLSEAKTQLKAEPENTIVPGLRHNIDI